MFDWSSLILFSGIINACLCMIILLMNRKTYKRQYIFWLILILLSLILILIERIIRFSNLETYLPELLFITSPLFFLILPLIYTLQKQLSGLSKNGYLHFIVPLLSIIILFPSISMPNGAKLEMYQGENIKDPIWVILFYTAYAIFYLVSIFLANKKFKRQILNESADNEVESELLTNRLVFIASCLIIAIPLSFMRQYIELEDIYDSKLLFVIFSCMPHFFLYVIFSRKRNPIQLSTKELEPNKDSTKISAKHAEELLKYMKEQRPYLNQSLSLPELANAIGWSRSFLSQVINSELGKNFYDFVNEFRLKYVLERIETGEHKTHTLEYIATDAGFKSYVSFYRIFKKALKETPTAYIHRLEKA